MKLNVFERLVLLPILPKEGNFVTLKILRDLNSKLSLSEADFKEFEVTQKDDKVTWNQKGNEEREIEIGAKATSIICEALEELNKNKKLTERYFSLYEKFIGE